MTAMQARAGGAVEGLRWGALALVFGAAMLNYMDRQALSLLKPDLALEFHWSDADYAHINSGFQLATMLSMLVVGWFVDRAGLRTGYAAGVGGWSLAQISHVWVASVPGFFLVRVALAASEAVNLPAAVKAVSSWFDNKDRSIALGVMNLAPNIGAVATPLIVPAMAVAFGWKMAFIATGALGFFWLALWWRLPNPTPPSATAMASGAPGLRALLADRRTWAVALGKFFTDFVWVFLLFWAPDLFHKMFGLNVAGLSLPVALVFLMAGAGSLFGGWLSSRLLRGGRSLNAARKWPMALAAALALPVVFVVIAPNVWIAALLLGLTLAAHQMFSTSMFGLATDLFSAQRVGLVIGLSAALAGLPGLAINEFAGYVLDRAGTYAPMLAICAGAKVVALACVQLLAPDVDRLQAARSMTEPLGDQP